jgi:tetratricopeptide (TPR) repeat protein
MASAAGGKSDFFLSRRGSVAAIAQEVTDVLTDKGYKVIVQDYDIPLGSSFVDAMHEAVKNARDLIVLLTPDYDLSPYTRKEFTSFEALRLQNPKERHIIVLRCEDMPLQGLLADLVYQDLVGITDPGERQRRILAAARGESQGLRPPPLPFVGVPPRNPLFTGRAEELDRLDAILGQERPAAVTQAVGRAAIQGMGGIGKTSLTAEYAHRYRSLYAGVWWCPAETRTDLTTSLAALALKLRVVAETETDIESAAKAALDRLAEQRATWLLVYDNVTSPDEIADLLPAAGARLLITSRFSDWSGWVEEVPLDVLPLGEAVTFLQSRAARKDEAGAKELAEVLGRLPLALDHAAATCRRTQMSFAEYATEARQLITDAPRGAAYPRSVAVTFQLAITDAVARCPPAEALMAFLGQCGPERIPMTLVEGAIENAMERRQAVAALAEVSLVKQDPFEDGTPAVAVHRLVQAVAHDRSEIKDMTRGSVEHLITRLSAIYPTDGYDNPQSWPLCARLTPHLLGLREASHDDAAKGDGWANLLNGAGGYFRGRAAYAQAQPLYERALAIREKVLGLEHPHTAASLAALASLLQDKGELAAARPLFERALAVCEQVLGPEHPETATSLNNLALLLRNQGDLAAARPLYERALAIREKALGPEHPHTAASLNNLARLLQVQGDLAAARPLFERALAVCGQVLGPEHPHTAISLDSLALLLWDQGNLAAARSLLERALAIREKVLGPEHPETATGLNNLALLLRDQGDLAAARPLLERALAVCEQVLGPEHPQTATGLDNLALLLWDEGDLTAARPLFERALAISERVLGPEHPETAASLNNLALLLRNQGDLAAARPLLERALAIREKVLGPEHPHTAASLNNLARLLQVQGDFAELRRNGM